MARTCYRTGLYYAVAFCLYSIAPALAEQAPVTNIAGPTASSSGSVVNQGTQILNGPYMTQNYGGGVACQGASLSLSPFANSMINNPWDPTSYGSHTVSPGLAATFSIPLDRSMVSLCKERAKAEIERQRAEAAKARLDFELVRLLKCGEALSKGISFHPDSPYAAVCSDVTIRNGQPAFLPVSQAPGSN